MDRHGDTQLSARLRELIGRKRGIIGAVTDGRRDESEALVQAVNASGRAYLSSARLGGRVTVRIAVGNLRTTEDDVREVLHLVTAEAERLAPTSTAGR
jgi:hypothetical protein